MDLTQIMARAALAMGKSRQEMAGIKEDYLNFLAAAAASAHPLPCPSKEIDELWHAHILDTRRYQRDCIALFGKVIHHVPDYDADGSDCAMDNRCATVSKCSGDIAEANSCSSIVAECTTCSSASTAKI